MTTMRRLPVAVLILLSYLPRGYAGQLAVSCDALSAPSSHSASASRRFYDLKGDAQPACFLGAQAPKLSFEKQRMVAHMKIQAPAVNVDGDPSLG